MQISFQWIHKLRLVHQQILLLVIVIFITMMTFGSMLIWNLHAGFGAYLAASEKNRLEQLGHFVEQKIIQAGGVQALGNLLNADPKKIMDEFAVQQGEPPRNNNQSNIKTNSQNNPQGNRPPPPHSLQIEQRLALVSMNNEILFASPKMRQSNAINDFQKIVRQPIVIDGHQIAELRMLKIDPPSSGLERQFLHQQYWGIGGAAILLSLFAIIIGTQGARQLVRPLKQIEHATNRIANGELAVRLNVDRQDEIGELQTNVNRMAQALQRLEGARRRWLADISHELRTPLAILRGEIDAVRDQVRTLDMNTITSLSEEVERLNHLIDDLHLLSMSDLGMLKVDFIEINAVQLVHTSVKRFTQRALQAGIDLVFIAPPNDTILVNWDVQRIEQVIANVVDNALRYTYKSDVTKQPSLVRLMLEQQSDVCIIWIENTPPTMNKEQAARLFDPFYRTPNTERQAAQGSGLGLTICATLVAAHQGKISTFESDLGGLGIKITLPKTPKNLS